MGHGGARPGAGRKPGPSKRTSERLRAIKESGLSPLEYMLSILRDEKQDQTTRFEAAKAAAPYVHPRLQATAMTAQVLGVALTPGEIETVTEWQDTFGIASEQ